MSPDRMLRIETFEVDLAAGELFKDGTRVPIQEKPFQLLSALLERPGAVVSREELRARLWPDVVVDFDGSLNAAARKLREALGDSATEPRFVQTLPRRGYRFIARVDAHPGGGEKAIAPQGGRRPWPALAMAAGVVTILLALFTDYTTGRQRSADHRSAPGMRAMLAVLPFENLSGDPAQDYVSDGMTEELITALGRLDPQRLGVIARMTSMTYQDGSKTVDEIGRELGVDYVIEGSIRGTEEISRVTAQLILVDDQTHLWAETYDASLDDLLAAQADVAKRIARTLAARLLSENPRTPRPATSVPAAYDHYLKGRHQWNRFTRNGYEAAIVELGRAIELDPDYAEAHAALADAHNLQAFVAEGSPRPWFERARSAASRALELDPDSAVAHNSLAFAVLYGDYDAVTADPIFRRAIELDPNYAMAYHWHAGALAALGHHDQAIRAAKRAAELDPLSLSVRSDLGWYYLFADRWQEAADACRATLEVSPSYGWARSGLAEALLRQEAYEEVLSRALDALRSRDLLGSGEPRLDPSALADLEPGAAVRELTKFYLSRELAESGTPRPFRRAVLYSSLGDLEEAVHWLELSLEQHDPWMVFLRVDPRLDPLHGHPRFEALASRLRIGS